jgi:hypothetical protein
MPSDDKKKKLNQEQFQAWDREHREPTSPAPEEEVYVISDAERERMELEARLQRGVNGIFAGLRNKALQNAFQREHAAIKAKLDAELGQEPDLKKAAHPIPQRSLELPKIAKPEATQELAPAATPGPGADPPAKPPDAVNDRGGRAEGAPAPNGVPVASGDNSDDKEAKRIAVMNKVHDPKKYPFLSLDEAAAVLGLGTTRAVQKRIGAKKDRLERGPRDGTVTTDSVRKNFKIQS